MPPLTIVAGGNTEGANVQPFALSAASARVARLVNPVFSIPRSKLHTMTSKGISKKNRARESTSRVEIVAHKASPSEPAHDPKRQCNTILAVPSNIGGGCSRGQ